MQPHHTSFEHFSIGQLRCITILVWTILAIITTVSECNDNKRFLTSNALSTARACIEKDLIFRRWVANHGGVYVPVTEETPPNKWLNVPERDITTPSGRRLTLMNPSYMTRQLFEISRLAANAPLGHITSLKPVRAENAPDPWESRALKAFETGQTESGEFMIMGGKPVYRYMRPLNTEKPCLKCHAAQGYRENSVRGGISISIPTAGLEQAARQSKMNHVSIIAATWLMGLGGIWLAFRRISSATAALTEERDNLNSVFNATPTPMLLLDNRMEAVWVNSAIRDYCPDYDTLPDKRCGTILKCDNAWAESQQRGNSPVCESCRVMRALREVLERGLPDRGEVSIPRIVWDGNMMETRLLYSMEAVWLNGMRHALLSFTDITERTRMEEKLATSEREFRTLAENSPDAIARYDLLCRRIYVNPALERMAGQSADHLAGRTPLEASSVNREIGLKVQTAVQQVLDRGDSMDIELSSKDTGNVMRHLQIRFVPEFDANGKIASVLGITRDITSLRKAEAQLMHAQKMESIGTLAGGVAHDFNNLLSVVSGYAELLRLSLKGDKKMLAYVHEISDTVDRGAELTKSLLTFSGKHEPQKQYDDLNLIVANLQKSMSRLLRSDITLIFDLCDGRLPVFADRVQIEQVLVNLLVNARDAISHNGRIHVSTRLVEVHEGSKIYGTSLSPGTYGHVTIADNGTGMDDETMGRIFEPFFTTKEAGKGTGLGLAIVFGIVRNHNGCIAVESVLGTGTECSVYLPIFLESEVPDHVVVPEYARLYGNETVLVVEDEASVLNMTRETLEQYGYTVLTSADGLEALDVFEAHRDEIRVVVTDLIMPRMNGRAAIEQIRQQKPDLPVILMSGHTNDIVDSSIMEALNIVFLPKPVRPQKLMETIRTSLEG